MIFHKHIENLFSRARPVRKKYCRNAALRVFARLDSLTRYVHMLFGAENALCFEF